MKIGVLLPKNWAYGFDTISITYIVLLMKIVLRIALIKKIKGKIAKKFVKMTFLAISACRRIDRNFGFGRTL